MSFYNFFKNIIQFFIFRKKNSINSKTKNPLKNKKDDVKEDIYPLF